jgi:hypothetical protein
MQKERKKEGRSHLEEVVYFRRGVCTTIIIHFRLDFVLASLDEYTHLAS